ncbi:MAG: hypothetical protein U0R17_05810 [Acidimicrobiia bacterium]
MGKKLKAILISTMLMFMLGTTQVVNVSSAFAADGNNADFFIYVGSSKTEYMPGAFYDNNWIQVCSYGAGSIKTIDFDIQATNWNMTQLSVQERNEWNTATDLGSVDLNGVWNGLIEDNQCFTLFPWGTVTGNVGDTLTETVSVTSSTLVDDTPNQGVIQENSSPTISYPIVTPVYQVDLQTYIGMGNNQTTVYPDQTYQNWFNVCASGYGSVSEFDLDVQTSNWSNVTYSVQDNQWSNQDVLDKGTIDANGHWTGLMQAGQCVSFGGQGTVSGEIGQQASWNLNLLSSKLGDGSDNPGSLNNGGQPDLIQDIVEIVLDVDLNMYVGNNNVVFPVNGLYSNSWVHICTSGFGAVEEITFDFDVQGWTMTKIDSQKQTDQGNSATDPGSVTPESVWTGLNVRAGQCLVLNPSRRTISQHLLEIQYL